MPERYNSAIQKVVFRFLAKTFALSLMGSAAQNCFCYNAARTIAQQPT